MSLSYQEGLVAVGRKESKTSRKEKQSGQVGITAGSKGALSLTYIPFRTCPKVGPLLKV